VSARTTSPPRSCRAMQHARGGAGKEICHGLADSMHAELQGLVCNSVKCRQLQRTASAGAVLGMMGMV